MSTTNDTPPAPSPSPSPPQSQPPQRQSILSSISSSITNFKSRYSIQSQRDRALHASILFQSAKHQAHNPQWYATQPHEETHKLKPHFRQIHAMISLHVWFIHRRLFTQNKNLNENDSTRHDNLLLQEELFDNLWHDTKSRIRAQKINELTVNKHLEDAQRLTFVQMTQYDHALQEYPNDLEKRFELICDGVWRHVIVGDEETNDELIRRVGAYVEYQLENVIFKLPDDYFEEGRIGWGNVPDLDSFTNDDGKKGNAVVVDGETGDDEEYCKYPQGMMFYENNWVEVLTDAGEPYYWNMDTNETKWEKPVFS